jgi:hypothetical protein
MMEALILSCIRAVFLWLQGDACVAPTKASLLVRRGEPGSPKNAQRFFGCPACLAPLVLLILSSAISTAPSFAQDYPAHPVKIVVPFGAGGPADVYSRVLAQHLSEALKQPFVVEDRPGAGSIIGSDAVAKSPPDGYTLLAMSNTHTTNESLITNKPFVLMRDFVPVAAVNYSDLVMVIHPSVPAKDLRELIAYAKARPGELNYASSGTGTPYHMAAELVQSDERDQPDPRSAQGLRRGAQHGLRRIAEDRNQRRSIDDHRGRKADRRDRQIETAPSSVPRNRCRWRWPAPANRQVRAPEFGLISPAADVMSLAQSAGGRKQSERDHSDSTCSSVG